LPHAEFLTAIDDDHPNADRKLPKVISSVDPCLAWTAKANKRVQFGYGLNSLIYIENAVIVLALTECEFRDLHQIVWQTYGSLELPEGA
jgi:hypothetical protein